MSMHTTTALCTPYRLKLLNPRLKSGRKALAYSNVGATFMTPVNCGFDKSNPYNIG